MGLKYSYYSTIVWVIFNHCLECVTVVGVVPLTSVWLKSSNTCDLNTKSSQKPASSSWVHDLLRTPEPAVAECELSLDTLSWIVMFVTMPVVGLLSSPFAGWMCDRYGAVRIQIIASGIMVMTNCLYAFSDQFEMVILARAINGVGTSLILSSECTFVLNQSPCEKVKNKTVFGLYCASGMEYIGITFIGVLFEAIGQAIPFLLIAVCFLVSAIMLTCFGLPRDQAMKRNINNNNNNNRIDLNVTHDIQEHSSDGFMSVLRDRKILIAAYLTFASTFPRASLLSVYGIWASEEFGATVKEYSLAWLPSGCFYIAIHILGICIIVNYSKHSWFFAMVSLFIGASLTLVVPWTPSLVTSMFPLALSISFGSLCRTMVIADITSYSKRKFPSLSGRVSGLIMFSGYFIPYILGPIQAILLINSYGLVAATVISSIISFLALPLTPLLRNHSIEPEEIPLLHN